MSVGLNAVCYCGSLHSVQYNELPVKHHKLLIPNIYIYIRMTVFSPRVLAVDRHQQRIEFKA